MIRIAALNDADKEADDEENGNQQKLPSQQAQEAEILTRYNEALSEQRKNNIDNSIFIFEELLASPFLAKAESVENSQETSPNGLSPIYGKTDLNIKYSCLKNLAQIYKAKKKLNKALEYYISALELDGTDVMMWYQAGIVSSKLGLIHFAPRAFLRGISCSNQNWLCLDRAAISLFIEGDFSRVMELLSYCFKLNPDYHRGLLLRDIMLDLQPWLKDDIKIIYPNINLLFEKTYSGPADEKEKLLKEIDTLRENFYIQKRREAEKPVVNVELVEPLSSLSWEAVGDSLILLKKWFDEENENARQRRINLLTKLPTAKHDVNESQEPVTAEEPMVVDVEEDKEDVEKEENQSEQELSEEKRGRKRRSGSALMEELFWSGKRRSTRVRANRKEQEAMSVADALSNILPRNLLHKVKPPQSESKLADNNSMDTMDMYRLFEKQGEEKKERNADELVSAGGECNRRKLVEKEGYFRTLQEENDVKAFLESQDKLSFVEILHSYVLAVEKQWEKIWPKKLINTFNECYKTMRCYFPIQLQFLSCDELRNAAYEESGATLLYHELMVDILESNSEKTISLADMQPIIELVNYPDTFANPLEHAKFELRLMWVRANMFLGRGQSSEAISFLYSALDCYTEHPVLEDIVIKLPNCQRNREISKSIVQAALDAQSRKKSLAEVLQLYHEQSYKEVIDILKDYFISCGQNRRDQEKELVDRSTQLTMIINSLYQLDEYKQCVSWLETSCYELLTKTLMTNEDCEENSQEWKIEFDRILVAMEECSELGDFEITTALSQARLSRFVQTLCRVICKQLEDSERPPCASRPWIMLNSILIALEKAGNSEDNKTRKQVKKTNSEDEEDEIDIPPSILVLFTAHEYLGRREWCNCDGNVLLYRILDQVIPRIRSPDWASFRDTIQQYLDQAVYCLYAHPSKKNKAKSIIDHNVAPVPMTWEHAMQLFQLYRPDETPCFDSIRTNNSSDYDTLFRRIAALVPEDIDPAKSSEVIDDYIYGRCSELPKSLVKLPTEVQDLFYIIGDHYFRTHESAKAIKYLMSDLCANIDRVDAWAIIALSKGIMLEHNLIHCEPIKIEEFLVDALATVRCFEHCLKLDGTICTLWIEYGTFCFTIHSFCSQRMKLESDSLSLEQFEEMETTKIKMLESAKDAFINANNIWSKSEDENRQDERWLHHYMLGKICEKYGDLSYIDHYGKAAFLLYENNAFYPKKISYNSPQTLAIEAMEIYYRAHVCVIKCLELHDGELVDEKMRDSFVKFVDAFSESPFAKRMSKADLAKKKIKEAEANELAIQREKDVIKGVVSNIVDKIELKEEEEKQNNMEIIRDILNNLIEKVVLSFEKKTEIPLKKDVKNEDSKQVETIEMDTSTSDNIEQYQVEEIEDELLKLAQIAENDANDYDRKLMEEELELLKLVKNAEVDDENMSSPEKLERRSEVQYAATMYCPRGVSSLPPNTPMDASLLEASYDPYPHEQLLEDNYYLTLDDLTKMKQPSTQIVRKRPHASAASSVSSDSEQVTYADESSSSSSETSSSSSSETESDTNKKRKKRVRPCTPPKIVTIEQSEEKKDDGTNDDLDITPIPDKNVSPEVALLQQCLSAFEICAVRFPQHYKSVYRLAHFYYRSKNNRDLDKCRDLLLGQYKSPFGNICGLFSDRKNTNFFNGIWRLPSGEVDRPGSFASHMSRSVLLLLEVLRDLRDAKLLLELCLQLRKVPEPDKRYLREDERSQLSNQAMTLSLQTLRQIVRHTEVMTLPIVLDTYRMYRKVQKHYPAKTNIFADNLLEAFNRLGSKGVKCSLEQCLKFCQGELTGNRMAFPAQFIPSPKSGNSPKVRKIRNVNATKPKAASIEDNVQPKEKEIEKEIPAKPKIVMKEENALPKEKEAEKEIPSKPKIISKDEIAQPKEKELENETPPKYKIVSKEDNLQPRDIEKTAIPRPNIVNKEENKNSKEIEKIAKSRESEVVKVDTLPKPNVKSITIHSDLPASKVLEADVPGALNKVQLKSLDIAEDRQEKTNKGISPKDISLESKKISASNALDLCKTSKPVEQSDLHKLSIPKISASVSVSIVKDPKEVKEPKEIINQVKNLTSNVIPSFPPFLSLPKDTNISITPVPLKVNPVTEVKSSTSATITPAVSPIQRSVNPYHHIPPVSVCQEVNKKPASVITSTASVQIKKVGGFKNELCVKKPAPEISSKIVSPIKESRKPTGGINQTLGKEMAPILPPGFLPNALPFGSGGDRSTGPGPFPMNPQQAFFGFPVNYTTEAYMNQYSSFVSDYLAMAHGTNPAHRIGSAPPLPKPSAVPSSHSPQSQRKLALELAKLPNTIQQTQKPQSSQKSVPHNAHTIQKSLSDPVKTSQKQSASSVIQLLKKPTLPPNTNQLKPSSSSQPPLHTTPIEQKGKFNIADILSKNPNITVTHSKVPPITSSDPSGQSEAMNLCAKTSKNILKRSNDEPQTSASKKSCPPAPELVTIDD